MKKKWIECLGPRQRKSNANKKWEPSSACCDADVSAAVSVNFLKGFPCATGNRQLQTMPAAGQTHYQLFTFNFDIYYNMTANTIELLQSMCAKNPNLKNACKSCRNSHTYGILAQCQKDKGPYDMMISLKSGAAKEKQD